VQILKQKKYRDLFRIKPLVLIHELIITFFFLYKFYFTNLLVYTRRKISCFKVKMYLVHAYASIYILDR